MHSSRSTERPPGSYGNIVVADSNRPLTNANPAYGSAANSQPVSTPRRDSANRAYLEHVDAMSAQLESWRTVISVQEDSLQQQSKALSQRDSYIMELEEKIRRFANIEGRPADFQHPTFDAAPALPDKNLALNAVAALGDRELLEKEALARLNTFKEVMMGNATTKFINSSFSEETRTDFVPDYVIVFPNPDYQGFTNMAIDEHTARKHFKRFFKGEELFGAAAHAFSSEFNFKRELEAFVEAFRQLEPYDPNKPVFHNDTVAAVGDQPLPLSARGEKKVYQHAVNRKFSHGGKMELKGEGDNAEWHDTGKGAPDYCTLLRNTLIAKLSKHCGLTVKLILCSSGDSIYALISCDEEDLRLEAERSEYNVQFDVEATDPNSLEPCDLRLRLLRDYESLDETQKAASGVTPKHLEMYAQFTKELARCGSRLQAMKTVNEMMGDKKVRLMNLWDRMLVPVPMGAYADYKRQNPKIDGLWRVHTSMDGTRKSLFRNVDRLKLLMDLIGRQVNLSKMISTTKAVVDLIPLHDFAERQALLSKWEERSIFKMAPPLHKIRSYFGEKIALYFAFLSFYTVWLVVPGILGVIVFIIQRSADSSTTVVKVFDAILCLCIAVWVTVLLEFWKRKQNTLSIQWGQVDFEDDEVERPGFEGNTRRSPVTDDDGEIFFDHRSRLRRVLCGSLISSTLIACVIAAVAGILILRTTFVDHQTLKSGTTDFGPVLTGIINAIQIQFFNFVYGWLAVVLNNWENHRTQTDYEDNLIAKAFLFKFVNSYNTLYYIGFLKQSVEGCYTVVNNVKVDSASCLPELSTQLGTIFVVQVVMNAVEIGVPWLQNKMRERHMLKAGHLLSTQIHVKVDSTVSGASVARSKSSLTKREMEALRAKQLEEERLAWQTDLRSVIEKQIVLQKYETKYVDGTFNDYMELVVQYGFVTQFVVAFPLAPIAAFGLNLLEMKVDSYKLMALTRRSPPSGASDIGQWYWILEIVGIIAVGTNCALLCFATEVFEPMWWFENKYQPFVILLGVVLLIKMVLRVLIRDVPSQMQVVMKRHDHITTSLFKSSDEFSATHRDNITEENLTLAIEGTADDSGKPRKQSLRTVKKDSLRQKPNWFSSKFNSFRAKFSRSPESSSSAEMTSMQMRAVGRA
eukprot:GILK01004593.1.p1 GENE.GILK01004593.1~~GILK01004593.1.p1  ORF type:complete len:1141 (+),score=244.57 GILK01004593.1:62-3484(+)